MAVGFLFNAFTVLFVGNTSWEFLSNNVMWLSISLALFHSAIETLQNKDFKDVLQFWILPTVNFVCWWFVGLGRLTDSAWLTFAYNLSWSVIIAVAAVWGCSQNKQADTKNFVKKWCTLMLIVLGVRVLVEFMMCIILG